MTSTQAHAAPDTRTTPRRSRNHLRPGTARGPIGKFLQYVGAFLLVSLFVFPFVVMLTTAFKPDAEIFTSPPRLLPDTWTLASFIGAFDAMPVGRYFLNTVFVTSMTVLGTLLVCPLVAYALAKVRWIGQKPLMVAVLATMMLPPQVTMIPLYMLWGKLGAHGTYWPLILPAWMGTPFLIFMIRQFLLAVPDELLEAARIDGANEFRIYRSVVLPLALPALATAGVFQFVWTWTDFLNPLIYLNDAEKYTISIGLYNFFGEQTVAWGPLMAACVLFTVPAVLVFLVGRVPRHAFWQTGYEGHDRRLRAGGPDHGTTTGVQSGDQDQDRAERAGRRGHRR